MQKPLVIAAKTLGLFSTTFIIFFAAIRLIGAVGIGDLKGIPSSLIDAYGPSTFVKNGALIPAFFTLISLIIVHLFVCFLIVQKGMRQKQYLKGLLYGAAFGVLWAFGFLELTVVYNSDLLVQVKSSIRDGSALAVFGLLAGVFFGTRSAIAEPSRKSGLLAVPLCALGFALFHGAQYYLAFPALDQSIDNMVTILWLLGTGGWIGFMYFILNPRIKKYGWALNVLFFTIVLVGINWALFTFFFNLYLDIPVFNMTIRCLFDLIGIALGLSAYEFLDARLRKREKRDFLPVD
jgi:hypothetical protein